MPLAANGDCSIYYETLGDGPPLVMIYGIGGNARRWWTEFPLLLAAHYQVVLIDNRGTGRSVRPKEPWSMEDMVADVHAVAKACRLKTFHLLGCSLGSLIARHYAAVHPEKLRSLALLCPPNGIPATPEDMRLGILWDPETPRVESDRASWAVVHPDSYIRSNEPELLADFELSESERTPGRTFAFQLQAVAAAADPLPAINAAAWPVLIAHGTVDRLVPPDNARTLAMAIPRARLRWLPNDSHSFWQHDPGGSASAVLPFLDAAEAARSA